MRFAVILSRFLAFATRAILHQYGRGAKDKKMPKGFMFWSFITLYGLFRTIVELFRAPDEQIGFIFNYFTMGQLLSFPLFLIGLHMIFRLRKKQALNQIN